ncbi:MAG: OmpA/MotB domain protein [Chlorobi bacterium]|nr:OmpA/MotB domain protein [Chlorobiota bacterium]
MNQRSLSDIRFLLLGALLWAGCRSFDKSILPLIEPTAPSGYRQPIYMVGTRSYEQIDPGKMIVDVWKVRSETYPDSVSLYVRVYDSSGQIVTNLAPPYYKGNDDYRKIWSGLTEQIGDDGKVGKIDQFTVREFSDQDAIPYELSLALDYSGTMGNNINGVENAASAFIRLKRAQDRISVVKFDRAPKLVLGATSSQSDLLALFNGTGLKGYGSYSAIYQAAKLGADQVASSPADHPRAVVLLTDGEDNASTIPASELYKFCRDNNIPIFTIAFGAVNRDVLSDISTYTGGRFYQTYTNDELKSAFEDIYRSLRNYYLVTYRPPNVAGRHIARLTLTPPNSSRQVAASATYNTLTGDIASDVPVKLDKIYFDYNMSTLRPESQESIAALASAMKDHPRLKIEVRGHTDSKGTEEYNQKLSEARAAAVRDALVALGIPQDRVRSRGFGFSLPVATNETDEGRQKNRRTEFVVLAR